MIIESKVTAGIRLSRPGTGPLISKGRIEFEYRSLFQGERELVDAFVKAKLIEIVEPDPPADVLPFRAPADPPPPPVKRRRAARTG